MHQDNSDWLILCHYSLNYFPPLFLLLHPPLLLIISSSPASTSVGRRSMGRYRNSPNHRLRHPTPASASHMQGGSVRSSPASPPLNFARPVAPLRRHLPTVGDKRSREASSDSPRGPTRRARSRRRRATPSHPIVPSGALGESTSSGSQAIDLTQ